MKLFYFLANNFSYTSAISIFTVTAGILTSSFGAFLGTSFIIYSNDKFIKILVIWLPVMATLSALFHCIQFGVFTRLKIPAFFKSHRLVNNVFKDGFNVSDEDLEKSYRTFSDITMHNTLAAVLYAALSGILIIGVIFYYKSIGFLTLNELKVANKAIILSDIIVIILYGMFTYLLTESITSKERSIVYNKLLKKGIKKYPNILIGIRIKFIFFIVLMIIAILTFTAIMEKSRFYNEYSIVIISGYFLMSIFAGIILMLVTTNSIVTNLGEISRVSRIISSGGDAEFDIWSLDKEFASIEYAMMEMSWEITDFRKDLEDKVNKRTEELQNVLDDLEGKDRLIQKQLDMASVIQRGILPGKIDDWNELKFAKRYIAMEKIGGDFYDIQQLKDNKLGILIADVSGHGIPAALVTTMAKISFGNAASLYSSPRKIFQDVNQNILDHIKTQDYMTCFMIAIDDEYNFVYSNASHQKAIHLKREKNEIDLCDTNGLFVGALEEARDTYEEKMSKLEYGDRLILYTDGIPEAVNVDRKEYSTERFESLILENKDLPLEEFAEFLIDDLESHIGAAQIEDDITLLIIELVRDEAVEIVKMSNKELVLHNYNEAIALLEEGIKKYAGNQKILYSLGKNYFRIGKYEKSIDNFSEYIEHDKNNKYAYYIIGSACFQLEDYKKAIEYYQNSLRIDAYFVNSLFAQGMAYKKDKNYNFAKANFIKVVNLEPNNKKALFELKLLDEEDAKKDN